jgi:glycosyltransferase involved in cell wall biosynthesis
MKRILLIIPSGGVGGIERLAINFYNFYKEKGYFVKVLKVIKQPSDIVNFGEDELYLSDIDFIEIKKINRLLFYVKSPYNLRKIIKKYKFDCTLGFGDMPNIFSSLTFTNEYKIVSLHALKSVELSNNSFLSKLSRIAYKTSYKYLDKVVCISQAIKTDLINNCDFSFKNKLQVIYNPHNIKQIQELATIPIESEFEKSIFEKKTILFLGRLTLQKAPWHLLKSFALLNDKNVNLVFVGDAVLDVQHYLDKIIVKYDLSSSVFFLGRKSNPYQYLSKASLLALSSYYEGTPNVIVESIAVDVPIVSSNCTDGIIELMSISKKQINNDFIETESGIITPNFFKGKLFLPETMEFLEEEQIFANALKKVLNETSYKKTLIENKLDLLKKVDLESVAMEYLS